MTLPANRKPLSGDLRNKQFRARGKAAHRRAKNEPEVDSAAGNIVAAIPTGRITWWDGIAESIFGYKAAKMLGQPISVLFPVDRCDELPWIMERIKKGKSIDGYETVRRRKDGRQVRVFLRITPVVSKTREIIGVSATVRNLPEKDKVSDARNMGGRARWELVEEAPFGALCLDLNGKVKYANRAVAELLGYRSREELFDLDAKTQIFEEARHFEQFLSQNRSQEGFRNAVATWRASNGESMRVRLQSGMVRRNEKEEAGCVVFVYEQPDGYNQSAEPAGQNQKMEALGRLASGVAHDFNNVLGVMLGYAQLLLRTGSEEKRQANVAQILRAGSQARALTRQLQTFGHARAAEARIIDLNERVATLGELLRSTMDPGIDLIVHLAPGPCRILADGAQIDQVLIELASHARKMMAGNGRFTIETAILCKEAVPEPMPENAYIRLSVTDTGRGMSPDEIAHIFEPFFFPGEKRSNGNGLELATVYGMVKQNGGYILTNSRPGYGTTFTMYFPRAESAVNRELEGKRQWGGDTGEAAASPQETQTLG